jgi:hypothetical protein
LLVRFPSTRTAGIAGTGLSLGVPAAVALQAPKAIWIIMAVAAVGSFVIAIVHYFVADRKPQSAFSIGPSAFQRSPLEGAVARSLVAFEKIDRERAVQGEEGLFDRLLECAGETDRRLEEAHAGALRVEFRQDGLHPPHGINEQVAYLRRQIDLFENALHQLRSDEAGL